MYGGTDDRQRKHSRNAGIRRALLYWVCDRMGVRRMIGVTHIGTVTAQGTEEERREMFRVMGAGLMDDPQFATVLPQEQFDAFAAAVDTQEVERLQARVSELEAALAAHGRKSDD